MRHSGRITISSAVPSNPPSNHFGRLRHVPLAKGGLPVFAPPTTFASGAALYEAAYLQGILLPTVARGTTAAGKAHTAPLARIILDSGCQGNLVDARAVPSGVDILLLRDEAGKPAPFFIKAQGVLVQVSRVCTISVHVAFHMADALTLNAGCSPHTTPMALDLQFFVVQAEDAVEFFAAQQGQLPAAPNMVFGNQPAPPGTALHSLYELVALGKLPPSDPSAISLYTLPFEVSSNPDVIGTSVKAVNGVAAWPAAVMADYPPPEREDLLNKHSPGMSVFEFDEPSSEPVWSTRAPYVRLDTLEVPTFPPPVFDLFPPASERSHPRDSVAPQESKASVARSSPVPDPLPAHTHPPSSSSPATAVPPASSPPKLRFIPVVPRAAVSPPSEARYARDKEDRPYPLHADPVEYPEAPASKEKIAEALRASEHFMSEHSDVLRVPEFFNILVDLLYKWRYVFAAPRPRSSFVSFKIREGALPCTEGIRRNLHGDKNAEVTQRVYDDVMKFVEQGMVEVRQRGGPCPEGMWCNPYHVVVTQKARESSGSGPPSIKVRMCLDARYLNRHIVDESVTWLPDLRDMIQGLSGLKIASAFDVSQAFQQMQVPEELRDYLGFVILEPGTGVPLWCRHSAGLFGLTSLPGNFHGNLESRLRAAFEAAVQLQSYLSLFIDDTGAFTYANPARGTPSVRAAPDSDEMREIVGRHMTLLDTTLRCFWNAGLSVNLKKCYFLSRMAYLVGVQSDGITHSLDLKSTQGIDSTFAGPPSLRFIQGKLGQAVYVSGYLDSIKYLDHSGPLYDLCTAVTAEEKAHGVPAAKALLKRLWSPKHEQCVHALHLIIKERYALLFPDVKRPLWVFTDASNYGAGCVAGQFHPVTGRFMVCCSMARRFTRAQQSWSVGGREAWATLQFMRAHWRLFSLCDVIWGGDHHNLLTIDQLDHAHVQRWFSEMAALCPSYILRRVHLNGEAIALADFLSRWCVSAPTTRDLAPKVDGKKPAYTSLFGGASAQELTLAEDEGDSSPAPMGFSRPLVSRADMPVVGALATPQQLQEERLTQGLTPSASASVAVLSSSAAPQGLAPSASAPVAAFPSSAALPPLVLVRRHEWRPSSTLSAIILAQQQMPKAERDVLKSSTHFSTLELDGAEVLCIQGRIFIPDSQEALILEVCKNLHEVALPGIPGVHGADSAVAAKGLVAARLWINNFSAWYKKYVAACPRCQQVNQAPPQLPRIIPMPIYRPGDAAMMDYLDIAPADSGETALLVIIDMASRYTLLHIVKSKTSHEVRQAFRAWRQRLGRLPALVLCDQGSHFTSRSLTEWFSDAGVVSAALDSTAYNSQGRGRVERTNQRVLHYFKVTLPAGSSSRWVEIVDECFPQQNYWDFPFSISLQLSPNSSSPVV